MWLHPYDIDARASDPVEVVGVIEVEETAVAGGSPGPGGTFA